MSRCRSWRPRQPRKGGSVGSGGARRHEQHAPGTCRRCWEPCTRKIDGGGGEAARCDSCLAALRVHPDPLVRMHLVSEPPATLATLAFMTDDADAAVALVARHRLEQMNTPELQQRVAAWPARHGGGAGAYGTERANTEMSTLPAAHGTGLGALSWDEEL